MNLYYGVPENGAFPFTYWAFYIVVCIGFAKFILDATWQQAVYCAVCGCGMQHIAFDIYLIYQISVWILSILDNSAIAGFEAGMWHRIIYRVIDGLCCVYVLWVQINQKERMSLQRELDGINSAWRQQKKQYQVTSETIESINRKCHDLKHQIRALREITDEKEKEEYFNEIENDIMIYDTALNTGNKALDTVMMEKGLFCKNHGIQWSCMADGTKLNFEEGLPVTTKKNKRDHGYGMKSIRYTAEKYNGTITVNGRGNIFMLQVLIPVG